jgi:hypothetical protein
MSRMQGMSFQGESTGGGNAMAHVELSLKDELMDFIEAKLVERQNLGISLQGAT